MSRHRNEVATWSNPLGAATLAILQMRLLTPDHAKLFVEDLRREAARLKKLDGRHEEDSRTPLRQLNVRFENLSKKLLASSAAMKRRRRPWNGSSPSNVLHRLRDHSPSPVPLERFEDRVAELRTALDDQAVRIGAAQIIATLIESVTIYPAGENGPQAEIVASIGTLLRFVANENSRRPFRDDGSIIALVAGTGFEPVTFRL